MSISPSYYYSDPQTREEKEEDKKKLTEAKDTARKKRAELQIKIDDI